MRLYSRKHLNLLREITLSQFKLKDQSTMFGFVWSFLNPLLMLTVLFIFFSARMGEAIEHYTVYLLVGIVHYTHFSNSTTGSMHVLLSMRHLTGNTVFPKELLVVGSVLASSIEFVISLVLVVMIALLSGVELTRFVVMLPLVIALQVMLVLWASLLLSCLYVFVRDINHIYQVFLRILFFVTPIFYDLPFVGQGIAERVVLLNPMTHLMGFSRSLVIGGRPFSGGLFLFLLLANTSLLVVSIVVFRRLEPMFAEHV